MWYGVSPGLAHRKGDSAAQITPATQIKSWPHKAQTTRRAAGTTRQALARGQVGGAAAGRQAAHKSTRKGFNTFKNLCTPQLSPAAGENKKNNNRAIFASRRRSVPESRRGCGRPLCWPGWPGCVLGARRPRRDLGEGGHVRRGQNRTLNTPRAKQLIMSTRAARN